jgi:hypothetical protein
MELSVVQKKKEKERAKGKKCRSKKIVNDEED